MSPASILSDSESEAVGETGEKQCGIKTKTKEMCAITPERTKEITAKHKQNSECIYLENIKSTPGTDWPRCEFSAKTVKCGIFESPSENIICVNSQGHIVERTMKGKHLYLRTHSLFTNCVLNPNTSDTVHFKKPPKARSEHHIEPLAIKKFTKNQIFVLLSLAIGNFISSCSMSIMAPFFPKEATEKGMGVSISGFVFSFYALGMFIMSPIVGKILPKYGAKLLFIIGLFLAGFSNVLFGFLPNITNYSTFVAACFLIRGLEAIGAGAFSTASFVFVVEVFPNNISTVLGILETFIGLGMSVGPAIGGILYSIGGFGLPFFSLGLSMILVVPVNFWFLPSIHSKNTSEHGSFWKILKIPSIFIIGLMVVVTSNIWSFLDPTLEPHLRQLNLTSRQIGLVFLLFSSVYGVFSLMFGCIADKVGNHWSMMVTGLLLSVICLLGLGPSPLLTNTPNTLWKNLVALSFLGISVALTLMPTFQALLDCAVKNGHKRELTTYSTIAGAWSCMYSLGEVIGPTLGGVLLDKYNFPICSTVMAAITLMVGLGSLIFFMLQSSYEGLPSETPDEQKPLLKKQDKRSYYSDLAGDSCVIFIPTIRASK